MGEKNTKLKRTKNRNKKKNKKTVKK